MKQMEQKNTGRQTRIQKAVEKAKECEEIETCLNKNQKKKKKKKKKESISAGEGSYVRETD